MRFNTGQVVWWLSGVNSPVCVGTGVQRVSITKVNEDGSYSVKNAEQEFHGVGAEYVYNSREQAIAAAINTLRMDPPEPEPEQTHPPQQEDNINHPVHYNSGDAVCDCGRRIECIDVTRHMDFNLGNALKYIWRSKYKNGSEDIKKAVWYLNDYLGKLSPESVDKPVNN